MLLSPRARFALAEQVRSPAGAPLGEVFAFLSGLYFRGKLAYARHFARPPRRLRGGVFVIVPGAGLAPPEAAVDARALTTIAAVGIDPANPDYREPLLAAARTIASMTAVTDDVVLLGSIASAKYLDVLAGVFGPRLCFPRAFVGRGDMSRGGLLLRAVTEDCELDYVRVAESARRGPRPARLAPLGRRVRGPVR